ncbi:MAG: hypothetical protein JRG73_16715 [Deltaproteobacteria bacterium]|nr:hypothetical protein [Deltaproteobacteria bacterium]
MGIESGRVDSRPQNTDFYFRRGVTYSYLTAGTFSARLSPGGFIFDVAGSSLFPDDIPLVLAVLNSTFAAYALKLINPTVNFQVGDLARLPVPESSGKKLSPLVEKAISLAKTDSEEDETTYDFVGPPAWKTGIDDVANRHSLLAEIESEIDEEVYRLYGISSKDREAIEAELAGPRLSESEEENGGASNSEKESEPTEEQPLTRQELALGWIGYGLGIVMGRFQPGSPDGLGRGRFEPEVARKLAAMADADGIMVIDRGHPDDIASRVYAALCTALGEEDAAEVVQAATGRPGDPETELRGFFQRDFFKQHIQQYRKRPIYWFLQSSGKRYGVVLFHEKITPDTLFVIMQRYLDPKIALEQSRLEELTSRRQKAQGPERRRIDKEIDTSGEFLAELLQFKETIESITRMKNQRGETAGYAPDINDGVLINMSPLRGLIQDRSYARELQKCWDRLEAGDYDWSHMAMRYWTDRVREKCKINKSYAIAHNVMDMYEGT